jgi:hypothetical protein
MYKSVFKTLTFVLLLALLIFLFDTLIQNTIVLWVFGQVLVYPFVPLDFWYGYILGAIAIIFILNKLSNPFIAILIALFIAFPFWKTELGNAIDVGKFIFEYILVGFFSYYLHKIIFKRVPSNEEK